MPDTTKPKSVLNLDEAAAYLGITVDELITSRSRGLEPGSLGYKVNGELVWKRATLKPPTEGSAS